MNGAKMNIQHFCLQSCSMLFSEGGNDIVIRFFPAGSCDLIAGHAHAYTHLIAE